MCVIAAVSVVLPWSTCPIVPTFTCGLVLSNLLFAMTDAYRLNNAVSLVPMMRIERMTSPLPRECSTTELHGPKPVSSSGAGEGNRTLVISLEVFCSAIELHPPRFPSPKNRARRLIRPRSAGGGGWIRTNVGARPTDLQSAPFSRSGTPPAEPEIMSYFRQLGKNWADFEQGDFASGCFPAKLRCRSAGGTPVPAVQQARCSRQGMTFSGSQGQVRSRGPR